MERNEEILAISAITGAALGLLCFVLLSLGSLWWIIIPALCVMGFEIFLATIRAADGRVDWANVGWIGYIGASVVFFGLCLLFKIQVLGNAEPEHGLFKWASNAGGTWWWLIIPLAFRLFILQPAFLLVAKLKKKK